MRSFRFILSVLLGAIAFGEASAAEGPKTFQVSALTFERPAEWRWVKTTSSMRKAQLAVSGKSGEAAEVVFFYFGPGNGGGVDANVNRWFGQFQEDRSRIQASREEVKIKGRAVTFVTAQGTFLSGSPFGPKTPKPGYALLAAIIEHPKGNVFVKMTGPKETTLSSVDVFRTMIASGLK